AAGCGTLCIVHLLLCGGALGAGVGAAAGAAARGGGAGGASGGGGDWDCSRERSRSRRRRSRAARTPTTAPGVASGPGRSSRASGGGGSAGTAPPCRLALVPDRLADDLDAAGVGAQEALGVAQHPPQAAEREVGEVASWYRHGPQGYPRPAVAVARNDSRV